MKNVAVFGGSFNPITIAHIEIVNKIIDLDNIDEVWVIPNYRHRFNKSNIDFDHRYEMTKEVFSNRSNINVMNIDKLFNTYPEYDGSTYMLMSKLSMFYPDNNFYIVIGEDNAKIINKWNNYKDLIRDYNFITFEREESTGTCDEWYKNDDNICISFDMNISSTMVRNNIENGISIEGLVDIRTANYIRNKNLY